MKINKYLFIFSLLWIVILLSPVFMSLPGLNLRWWSIFLNGTILLTIMIFSVKKALRFKNANKFVPTLLWIHIVLVFVCSIRPGNLTPAGGFVYLILLPCYVLLVSFTLDSGKGDALGGRLKVIIDLILYVSLFTMLYSFVVLGPTEISIRTEGPGSLSPSNLGKISGMAALISINRFLFKRGILQALIALFSFVFLILTFSKGSYVAFFAGIMASSLYYFKFDFRSILTITVVSIFICSTLFLFSDFFVDKFSLFLSNPENLITLTGRTTLWFTIFDKFLLNNLWLGFGYHSASILLGKGFAWGFATVFQAHNAYIQSLINSGILGTFPLLLLLIKTIRHSIKRMSMKTPLKELDIIHTLFSLLVFFMVRGISEASFSQPGSLDVLFVIFIVISINIYKRPNEKARSVS